MKKWVIGLSIFMALLFIVGVAFIVAGLQREPVAEVKWLHPEMIEDNSAIELARLQPLSISFGWEAANV